MPIRVECTKCHKVTYFADNDAGLAVACLTCKTHLRVPIPAAVPKAVTPAVHPDEPPPLFASTPKHLMVAPPSAKPATTQAPHHHETKPRPVRPVRPASPRSRWRLYGILLAAGALGITAALINKHFKHSPASPQANVATQPTTQPNASISTPAVVAKANAATTKPIAITPRVAIAPPVLASITPQPPATVIAPRTYTPAHAPVGFIGFERVEIAGRTLIDSYNSTTGPYAKETASGNAALLSNGPIQLTVEGQIRGAVHSGVPTPIKPGKKLTITGPTDPLITPLPAPVVALDPLSHDSANSGLPKDYFKNANFNLYGKHAASLPAGVYYVNDLVIDSPATLHLDGPVTFLVSGQVTLLGKIETQDQNPANCRIRLTSDKQVTISHNNSFHVDLYAPQSPIKIDGKGDLYGSIVGRTLTVNGSRNFHFDESLTPH